MTLTSRSNEGFAASLIDTERGIVSRDVFVSDELFQQEIENLFPRTWLFVGHESQIPNVGDFYVSRMGSDSVIMTRDNEGKINVLLNSCRHRGMKVCRYDEGNTMEFYCPFHGWTYSVDGSLVTYPGELFGVPHFESAYGGNLNKAEWGLVTCPQVKNYKGLIFATFDPTAPSFEEYTGDFHYWLDNLTDGSDGTPGGAEVFHGVHKWRVHSNWKLVMENFLSDAYHAGPTHISVEAVGIGPGGREHTRHGLVNQARQHRRLTSFPELGHGSTQPFDGQREYPYDAFGDKQPVLRDYFKQAWEKKVAANAALGIPVGAMGPANFFPNMSFHSSVLPRTILVSQPISATETEMWRWYIIDKDAPPEVRDWVRRYSIRYSGPAGLTEQDDMENWDYATDASRGAVARRHPYNYEQGMGNDEPSKYLKGAVESTDRTEQNAVNWFKCWAPLVDGEEWHSIIERRGV